VHFTKNQFRLDLRSQIPDGARINGVAVKWGFWHSGKLAEDLVPIIWGASLTNGKTLGNKPLIGLDLY
jgi:hypothetical protein